MKLEKSCGAIVYKLTEEGCYYLLVQQKEGFWAFPKGHIEEGETEEKCAKREIEEETGLILLPFRKGFREVDEHPIPHTDKIKQIVYFLAEAIYLEDFFDQEPKIQKGELLDARFVTPQEAKELLSWESHLSLLQKAEDYLEAEKQDKEFCLSANEVLEEAGNIAVTRGMNRILPAKPPKKGRVLLVKDGWVLDCVNGCHEILITAILPCAVPKERFWEVADYYAAVIKSYPEEVFGFSLGDVDGLVYDRPGIGVSITYDDVYPTVEEILSAADGIAQKLSAYAPVARAIAKDQPVPKDNSVASKLYYEACINPEQ